MKLAHAYPNARTGPRTLDFSSLPFLEFGQCPRPSDPGSWRRRGDDGGAGRGSQREGGSVARGGAARDDAAAAMSVQEYLEKHLLSRKIEEAVNAAVRAKAPDPVLFISNHMRRAAPAVITSVRARQILDGRGEPAVEVSLTPTRPCTRLRAAADAPEGAAADAVRDAEKRKLLARAVADAVRVINEKVSEALVGMDPQQQSQIDQAIMDLDKAHHKVNP